MIIRNVSCSFLLHIKYDLARGSVSGKYRVQPESKNSNVNDILNWFSIVRNLTPSF